MGGEDDGGLRAVVLDDGAQHVVAGGRIDAADGFVQQVERGAAGHYEHQLHLLNRALREGGARGVLVHAQAAQHVVGQRQIEVGVEVSEEGEHFAHSHGAGEVRALRQEGDLGFGLLADGDAVHQDLAGGGVRHAGDHFQQRGLAGAVRAQQSHNAPGRDFNVEVVEGNRSAVGFGNIRALQQRRRGRLRRRCGSGDGDGRRRRLAYDRDCRRGLAYDRGGGLGRDRLSLRRRCRSRFAHRRRHGARRDRLRRRLWNGRLFRIQSVLLKFGANAVILALSRKTACSSPARNAPIPRSLNGILRSSKSRIGNLQLIA